MSDLVKEITNIQTFELLEERLGIRISGIYAVLTGSDDYYVTITAEIMALNGGEVEQNFKIQIVANDSAGNVVGAEQAMFLQENFFGLRMLKQIFQVYTTDIQTIKVFPVMW